MKTEIDTLNEQLHAKDYECCPLGVRHGRPFISWQTLGSATIKPLIFLHGRKWDDIALAWVHALRPSHIRVTDIDGEVQCDSQQWRVTVIIDQQGIINSIQQEVQVGITDGVAHGNELKSITQRGITLPV